MPFAPFISIKSENVSLATMMNNLSNYIFMCLLCFFLLAGCGSTPEPKNNEKPESSDSNDNLQAIRNDIVGMVTVDAKQNAIQQTQSATGYKAENIVETGAQNQSDNLTNNKNSYLAQQANLIAGLPLDIMATFEQALALMQQQKWQLAYKQFDQVIKQYPQLSASYVNQAIILTKAPKLLTVENNKPAKLNGQTIEARIEKLVDKAIEVNSSNPYAHHFKGQIQQQQGLFTQAEQSYAKALVIWPNYREAQLSMAILLELYRGKLQEAYQYYSTYINSFASLPKTEQESQENIKKKTQAQRWLQAVAIKIKRAGLTVPTTISSKTTVFSLVSERSTKNAQ
jgi:tetratricopeptide (TPR) repeat protein